MKHILTLESFINEEVDPIKEGKDVDATIEKCKKWLDSLGFKETAPGGGFGAEDYGTYKVSRNEYRKKNYDKNFIYVYTKTGIWVFSYQQCRVKDGYNDLSYMPKTKLVDKYGWHITAPRSKEDFKGSLGTFKTIVEQAIPINRVYSLIFDFAESILDIKDYREDVNWRIDKKVIIYVDTNITIDKKVIGFPIRFKDGKWVSFHEPSSNRNRNIDEKEVFLETAIYLSTRIDGISTRKIEKLEEIKDKPLEEQLEILKHTYRGATKMKKFGM